MPGLENFSRPLRTVVLTNAPPDLVRPLVLRLVRHGSVEVAGVFLESSDMGDSPLATGAERRQHAGFARILASWLERASPLVWMDHWAHPEHRLGTTLHELCTTHNIPLQRLGVEEGTSGAGDDRAERLMRTANPDLAVVFGLGPIAQGLLSVPRLGAIGLRDVQGIAGGTGFGAHALLAEVGFVEITIRRQECEAESRENWGIARIPIEEHDLPASLALKGQVAVRDLLVRALAGLSRGEQPSMPPGDPLAGSDAPLDQQRLGALARLSVLRARATRRAGVRVLIRKALAAAYLYCGYVQVRNALRRRAGKVPGVIVNFHRVADNHGDHWMTVGTSEFAEYLAYLRRYYRIVPLEELRRRLAAGRNTEHIAAITFDDGYRECATDAVAALERYGLDAAFYVCSSLMDEGGGLEHDRAAGFEGLATMRFEEARDLATRGFEIGSHSMSHADFRSASADTIEREVSASKTRIEEITGTRVRGFAVPFGSVKHCRAEVFAAARRAGYAYVLSHFDGVNFPGGDTVHLRRVRPPCDGVLTMHAAVEGWRGFSGLFSAAPETIVLETDGSARFDTAASRP